MEKWFRFQPEEYLEATRMSFLADEYAPVVAKRCGIRDGSFVLEAGCGTGAYSRYLAKAVNYVAFTGVDLDEMLLRYMNDRSILETNTFQGIQGNVLSLPFENDTFDAVCSHTFLNCVVNPELAMEEMMRVCKKGGIVSSVTAMSWENEGTFDGKYPENESWVKRFKELYQLVYRAYFVRYNGLSMAKGVPLNRIPLFFKEMGLKDVSILAVGRAFSLSDALIDTETKRNYILNRYVGEKKRLDYFRANFMAELLITTEMMDEFLNLLELWKVYWLEHLQDNEIWEWEGGSQLLVCGRKD